MKRYDEIEKIDAILGDRANWVIETAGEGYSSVTFACPPSKRDAEVDALINCLSQSDSLDHDIADIRSNYLTETLTDFVYNQISEWNDDEELRDEVAMVIEDIDFC